MSLSQKRKETLIIIAIWILIYASTPLYGYYALLSIQREFNWHELWNGWTYITAFLILFLLNHYIFIPKISNKKNTHIYFAGLIISLVLFTYFLVANEEKNHPFLLPHQIEQPKADIPAPQDFQPPKINNKPLTPPSMARLIIAILMLGADFGIATWLNTQKMRQRLLLLEKQNLAQELEHLRYQINPHFFMNTLNNIHALIDIDQERAKRAIIEISGLMRYSMYEGNNTLVNLKHEVDFLQLYVSLMKLRYNEKIDIICNIPENIPNEIMMPPLLLATFVENAFKHGISYKEKSFIHIDLSIKDENIHFQCENSRHVTFFTQEDGHHGIGLKNVRKRLDLQYTDNYTLNIDDTNKELFSIELILPNIKKLA